MAAIRYWREHSFPIAWRQLMPQVWRDLISWRGKWHNAKVTRRRPAACVMRYRDCGSPAPLTSATPAVSQRCGGKCEKDHTCASEKDMPPVHAATLAGLLAATENMPRYIPRRVQRMPGARLHELFVTETGFNMSLSVFLRHRPEDVKPATFEFCGACAPVSVACRTEHALAVLLTPKLAPVCSVCSAGKRAEASRRACLAAVHSTCTAADHGGAELFDDAGGGADAACHVDHRGCEAYKASVDRDPKLGDKLSKWDKTLAHYRKHAEVRDHQAAAYRRDVAEMKVGDTVWTLDFSGTRASAAPGAPASTPSPPPPTHPRSQLFAAHETRTVAD